MSALNSQQQEDLALSATYEDDTPTPSGWKRKLVPHIGKGLTPARTEVVFIAPDGEELKSKTQLQRYLKSNKGGPAISEFIWITDETPRRSSRLTSKTPIKVMKVESPPKAASKQKPAAEVPLEESKAGKRRHTERAESPVEEPKVGKGKRRHTEKVESPVEEPKMDKGKRRHAEKAESPVEDLKVGKGKRRHAEKAESPVEELKVGKGKRRHAEKAESPVEEPKVVKGKRTKKADKVAPIESKDEGRASTGSPPASRAKNSRKRSMKDVKKTKGAQAGTKSVKANGGAQMSKKDENVKEETMEESISHEANMEEPAKTNHSQGAELKGDKDDDTDDAMNGTMEDPEGSEEVDGGNGARASMLGSDPVAQSETLENDEEGTALGDEANHHAEKASSEGTAQD